MASKKTFEARQRTWTRYVASTSLETAARDAGVSPSTLRNFLQSPPTKRASEKKSYESLIKSRPTVVAREHNRTLVHSLSKKQIQKVSGEKRNVPTETLARVRITRATQRPATRETRAELGRRRANAYIISEGLVREQYESFSASEKARIQAAYGKKK